MIKMQSYKTRFIILIIGAVLFFPVVWKLALHKTFAAKTQLKELDSKLEQVENAPERIALVEKRLNYLNQLIINDKNIEELQERVLDEISTICRKKGLVLKEMPPMFRNLDNNYLVETINLEIAGSYHKLVQLVYELEKPSKNLNLVGINFSTIENKRLKTKQLVLSLYIQTLKQYNTD